MALLVALTVFGIMFFLREKVTDSTDSKEEKQVLLNIAIISDSESDFEFLSSAYNKISQANVDFVVHLGDITHLGVIDDLKKASEIANSYDFPTYFVPGDRDLWKSSGLDNFNAVFGQNYYQLEEKGVKFVMLDNSNVYEGLGDDQRAFIEQNIPSADFVFMHIPLYSESVLLGWKIMGQYSESVGNEKDFLLDLLRDSHAKAIFAGNQHLFYVTQDPKRSDLEHYVVGSLNKERSVQGPSFILLTIYEDKTYRVGQVVL